MFMMLWYSFNVLNAVNRSKIDSHQYSRTINTIVPKIWLTDLEDKFQSRIFLINTKTLKRIKLFFVKCGFKILKFKDLVYDLIIYKLLKNENVNKNIIYFKIIFQQKSFDNYKINKIFNDNYDLFPIVLFISVAYNCIKSLTNKILNYRQTVFTDLVTTLNYVCNNGNYDDYIDAFHDHVLTGDLKIISNKMLRF